MCMCMRKSMRMCVYAYVYCVCVCVWGGAYVYVAFLRESARTAKVYGSTMDHHSLRMKILQ